VLIVVGTVEDVLVEAALLLYMDPALDVLVAVLDKMLLLLIFVVLKVVAVDDNSSESSVAALEVDHEL